MSPPEERPSRQLKAAHGGEFEGSTAKIDSQGFEASTENRRCDRCLITINNSNAAGDDGRNLSGRLRCESCVHAEAMISALPVGSIERVRADFRHRKELREHRERRVEIMKWKQQACEAMQALQIEARAVAYQISSDFEKAEVLIQELRIGLLNLRRRVDIPELQRPPLLLVDELRRDLIVLIHGLHRRFAQ